MTSLAAPRTWVPVVVVTVAMIIAYIIFGLTTLTTFPIVWEDEPWYTQSAWSFATNGTFALPMFGDLAALDRDNVVYGRIYLLLMSIAYWLSDVNVAAVRMVSFVSGLVSLAAVYGIGLELWNRRVGAVAVVLLALAPNFVRQSHAARPEIMLLAAWTSALYLILSGNRTGSRWRLVAGSLIAGLAADTHLNGAIVPVALFLVLLVQKTEPRNFALFLLGLFIAFAWWAWVHVLQDPAMFLDQVGTFSRGLPFVDVLERPLQVFVIEAVRYFLVTPYESALLVLVAILGTTLLLLRKRDRSLLSLLVIAVTVFLFMALVVGPRTPIYAILLWPVFALLVARFLTVLPRALAIGSGAALVAIFVASIGAQFAMYKTADYDRYVASLRAEVPRDATVQGNPYLWFGFSDQPFVATPYFLWAGPYEDEVRRLGIDYVIVDDLPTLPGCLRCRDSMPAEVREFLEQNAELVAEIKDPFYGRVVADDGLGYTSRIFRINE